MATTSGSAQDTMTQPLTLEQVHYIQENNRIAAVLRAYGRGRRRQGIEAYG